MRIGLVALFAVCTFSYWWWGYTREVLPPLNAGLVVDEKELDFGEAWEDRAFPWKFTIHNPTGSDISIAKFWNTCSCAAVKPESIMIPAGGQTQVVATLDLTAAFSSHLNGQFSPKRPFKAEIVPQIDIEAYASKAWKVTGTAAKVLTISPQTLDLGEGFICGQPFPKQMVNVISHAPLQGIVARPPLGSGHQVRAEHVTDREWQLEFTLNPNSPVGRFRFQVEVQPFGAAGARGLPACGFHVHGMVWDDIRIGPFPIHLGARPIGEFAETSAVLSSRSRQDFAVVDFEATSKELEVTHLSDNPGKVYGIKQQIAALGHQTAHVEFTVKSQAAHQLRKVSLPVSYYGLPAK